MRREVVLSLVIGVAAGMLAGLTGVGGGVFLVPLLVGALYLAQHQAHGTSFVVIFPLALAGAITYSVLGHMVWEIILGLAFGGVLGVLLGARLMMLLPERSLRWLFGVFLVFVGFCMILTSQGIEGSGDYVATAGSIGLSIAVGFIAGILAGMMGVGGGVILVPGMVLLMGVDQHTAQGISLAVITFVAFLGILAHYRLENVRLRVALWIVPTAIVFSFFGSLVAHWLDAVLLRQLVGGLIIIVGVITVVNHWRMREMVT